LKYRKGKRKKDRRKRIWRKKRKKEKEKEGRGKIRLPIGSVGPVHRKTNKQAILFLWFNLRRVQ